MQQNFTLLMTDFYDTQYVPYVEKYVTYDNKIILIYTLIFFNFALNLVFSANNSTKMKLLQSSLDEVQSSLDEAVENNTQLSTRNDELEESNTQLNTRNGELEESNKAMTEELEGLHKEFERLNKTIATLQERNQVLCESLGDFIRYKKRKIVHSTSESELPSTYNLRPQARVDYSGQDTTSPKNNKDSDYDIADESK